MPFRIQSCHQYTVCLFREQTDCHISNFNNYQGIQIHATFRCCRYLHFGATLLADVTSNCARNIQFHRTANSQIFKAFSSYRGVWFCHLVCRLEGLPSSLWLPDLPAIVHFTLSENSFVKLLLTTLHNSVGRRRIKISKGTDRYNANTKDEFACSAA